MIRLILCAVLCLCIQHACTQDISVDTPKTKYKVIDSSLYLKGKKQATSGYIMFVAGAVITGTGALLLRNAEFESAAFAGTQLMIIAGSAAVITSIPLMISGNHKRKKARVSVALFRNAAPKHTSAFASGIAAGISVGF